MKVLARPVLETYVNYLGGNCQQVRDGAQQGLRTPARAWKARAGFAFFIFGFFVLSAFGQSTFGSIRGVATDTSGAAVPAATATLRSTDQSTTHSGERRLRPLRLRNLNAGHYTLTVSHSAFLPPRSTVVLWMRGKAFVFLSRWPFPRKA